MGATCGKVGARCGTIGICRDTEEVRRGKIGGACFGIEGVRCGKRKAAAAGGFDASSDMADTIAFGRCLGEYRCVP